MRKLYLPKNAEFAPSSLRVYLSIILLAFSIITTDNAYGQCTGCTTSYNTNVSITVNAGQVICLTYNGTYNKTITLNGGTLCIGSTTTINGATITYSSASAIINNGSISNNLTLGSGYTLTNNATITGSITINSGGALDNNHALAGNITMASGSAFNNYSTYSGSISQSGGTITNFSGGTFSPTAFTASGGSFINNSGATYHYTSTITFNGSYTFTNNGSASFGGFTLAAGGTMTLDGTETITGNVTNDATINLAGNLTITGNYSDNSSASINETEAGCSQLTITGSNNGGNGKFNGNNNGFIISPAPVSTASMINDASAPLTVPSQQPTALTASISGLAVTGGFTAPATGASISGYIVLRYIGASAPACAPTDNTAYIVGDAIGSCTVAALVAGGSTGAKSFTDDLPAGSYCGDNVYYRIFSYNGPGSCVDYDLTSPLAGSVAIPTATASISAGGATTFCSGGSVTLTASGAGTGGTYAWSGGASPSSAANTVSPATTTTYTVTTTAASGCTATASQPVTVTTVPTAVTVSGAGTFCGSATLTASGGTGGTIYWENTTSNGTSTVTASASQVVSSSGTYYFRADNTCGWGTQGSAAVTVNANPAISPITGTTTVCAGSATTLSDATTGGTWTSSNTSVATVIGGVVTGVAAGTDTIAYKTTNILTGCTSTVTATVTVNAVPGAVTVSGAGTYCGSEILTASGGTNGTIYWENTTSNGTSTATPSTSQAVAASGTYYFRANNTCGWSAQGSAAVTINPYPVVPAITGTTTVCAGSATTLSDATAGGTWTSATTSVATVNSSSGVVTGVAAGTSVISYTVTSAGCATTVTTTVTVNAIPVITITPPGPSTSCGSETLTASGGTGYVWSTGDHTASTIAGVGPATIYGVTVTNAAGCTAVGSTIVTVNANPTVSITPSGATTFCGPGTVTLTASGGGTYAWSSGQSTAAITASPASTNTYTVTVTSTGCTATASQTVTINTIPTAAISPAGPSSFCGPGTLTASGGGTYQWNATGGSAATAAITATASGTYVVTVTGATGGCTASASNVVTVSSSATATITPSGATTFCGSGTVTLTASGGDTYAWSTGAATAAITASPTATTTYTVTVTNSSGCTATAGQVVTINPNPGAVITATATNICSGSTATLTASGGSAYSWSTGAATAAISVSPASNTTYTVTVTSTAGCSAIASQAITVSAAVAITPYLNVNNGGWANTNTATLCAGGYLEYGPQPYGTWSWSGPAGFVSYQRDSTISNLQIANSGTYVASYVSSTGCTATQNFIFTVNASPTATISPASPSTFCGSGVLTASGGTSYQWNATGGSATTASITATASGTYAVTVTSAGCTGTGTASDVVTVNALPVVAAISGATAICAGSSSVLTDATTGGVWSASNANATVSAGTVTGISAGTDTISYKVTNASTGCATTVTTIITINALPAISPITGTDTVCIGNTTTLSDATGGGVWSVSNSHATISSGVVTGVSAGLDTIYYTETSAAGCTSIVKTIVTISSLPVVSPITGTTSVCKGNNITLADATGGGVWSSSNTSVATVNISTGVVAGIAAGSSTITYAVINGSGCVTAVSTTVTINALPVVSAISGSTTIVCAGSATTLSDVTPSGVWASSNTAIATINASGVVTGVSPGTDTISYTVTNASGCITKVIKPITINANPTASITPAGPSTFCGSGLLTASSSVGTGSTYQWNATGHSATTDTVTAFATGTYTVTVTNAGCTAVATASAGVTINANPVAAITASATSICSGTAVVLTASGAGTLGTYAWSNGIHVAINSVSPTTTTTYTVTASNTSGCSATASQLITVSAIPTAVTVSGAGTFCGTDTLRATGGTGGTMYWENTSATSTATTTPETSQAVSASGTYYFRSINTCGSAAGSAAVTINAYPTVKPITGTTTVCKGINTTLSDSTTGGVWSSSNTAVATISAAGAVTSVSAGSTTISYTVTSGAGCATIVTTTVTVNPLPIVGAITGTLSVCSGTNTALADTTAGGTWSSASMSVAIVSAGGVVSGLAAGTSLITYTATSGFGCTAGVSATVTVKASPVVGAITGTTSVCLGTNVTLADTTAGGTWSSSSPAIATITSAGYVTSLAVGATTISYSATNAAGCTVVVSKVFTVNAVPTAAISPLGPSIFCTSGVLTASGAGTGGSYLWNATGGSATTAAITATATGTYVVTVTTSAGCSATASNATTINTMTAAAITAGGATTFCAGGSVTLTASSGGSYVWNTNATTAAITVSPTATTTYTVTITSGVCTGTATQTVTVNPIPAVTVNSTTVCFSGTSDTLTATGGGTYLWSNSATTNRIIVSPTSTTTYRVTVTGSTGGCTATASSTVTINSSPTVAVSNPTICSGMAATLSVAGGSGGTYLWSPGGATTSSISVTTSGTYRVTVTFTGGCTATASGSVSAHTSPALVAGSNTPVCLGSTVSLTAAATDSSAVTYSWSGPNSFTSTSASPAIANGVYADSGTYNITVTDANGCSTNASLGVYVGSCIDSTTVGTTGTGHDSYAPCTQVLRFDYYNDAVASQPAGQDHTWALSNGSILTMNIKRLSTAGGFTTVAAPTWPGAAFGNTGYNGTAGKTVLYTTGSGYAKLTFSNIQLHDSLGNKINNYTLIGIDGESTDNSEVDTLFNNGTAWFDYDTILPPPTIGSVPTEAGIGTSQLVWAGNGPSNAQSRLVSTNNATSFTYATIAGGLQGFAMAVSNPIVIQDTFTICSNTAFLAQPKNAPAGTTYTWAAPVISPAGSITGASAQASATTTPGQTLVNTTTSMASATYYIIPSNNCSGQGFYVTVMVYPAWTVIVTPTVPQCIGNTLVATATPSPSGTYTYSWSGPNSFTATGSSFSITPTTALNSGTYTVTVTDQHACSIVSAKSIPIVQCVSVAGSVFDDANGDGIIDGTDAAGTIGQTLYSVLSDTTGTVVGTEQIASNGTFTVGNALPNTSGYTIAVSTSNPAIGAANPGYSWPSRWVGTQATYGTNNQEGTGIYSGSENVHIAFGTSNVTNMLIGYDRVPTSTSQTYTITSPGQNSSRNLMPANSLGLLGGNDAEDGVKGSGSTFTITSLAGMNGNELFYDANGDGVLESWEQITGYTQITNYIPGRLYIKFTGFGVVSAQFNYSTVDAASKVDPTPATYIINWPTPLPVTMLYFTADKQGETESLLKWATASEQNNAYFDVERSADAETWTTIGKVQGAGTTDIQTDYSMVDEEPMPGVNYYRLDQTDVDGVSTYSEIQQVTFVTSPVNNTSLAVYPNPLSQGKKLNVELTGAETISDITIVNEMGQVVYTTALPQIQDYQVMGLDLPSGIYIVSVHTQNNNTISTRLVIQK
jgi:hypothetical protein